MYSGFVLFGYGETYRLPTWCSGKESTCKCRRCRFDPCVGKIPWRRKWQTTPVFLPGKSPGQRSLVGYTPWGCKESYTTAQLHTHVCVLLGFPGGSEGKESTCNLEDPGSVAGLGRSSGRGHGNPLQYSCLENPMDRAVWWAIAHGAARVGHNLDLLLFNCYLCVCVRVCVHTRVRVLSFSRGDSV